MTRAITVRLDEADHAALERQADQVGLRPGTLARLLVRAGLSTDALDRDNADASAALQRLVRRSRPGALDATALVSEARAALEPDR